jgi:hypothetical protein
VDMDICTHPKLRRQVIRVRLVHLLPAREHVLQLVVIHLVNPFFERVGGFVLVRLECGEVLGDFVVPSRAERGQRASVPISTLPDLQLYHSSTLQLSDSPTLQLFNSPTLQLSNSPTLLLALSRLVRPTRVRRVGLVFFVKVNVRVYRYKRKKLGARRSKRRETEQRWETPLTTRRRTWYNRL